MTKHFRLIARQLAHLQRMRAYLAYSTQRVQRIFPTNDGYALSLAQHETLAAFRVRFMETSVTRHFRHFNRKRSAGEAIQNTVQREFLGRRVPQRFARA